MSVRYCNYCDILVDTDFDAEHFMPHDKSYECVEEESCAKDEVETANEYARWRARG